MLSALEPRSCAPSHLRLLAAGGQGVGPVSVQSSDSEPESRRLGLRHSCGYPSNGVRVCVLAACCAVFK